MRDVALRRFVLLALFCTSVRAKYRNLTVDSTDPSIQFVGNWSPAGVGGCDGAVEAGAFYGGTHNCTNATGTSAIFTFNGVAIYYINALIAGDVTTVVSLDSGPRILVNLSSEFPNTDVSWAVRWGASGLDNGPHTLVIYGPSDDTTPSGTWGEVNALRYTVVEHENIGAIVGGAIAGLVALILAAAIYHIFGQKLADWFHYLGYLMCGWLLFKYRRFIFISEVPHPTEITLFLTMEPHFPDSTHQHQQYLSWKVFKISPRKRQETIKLPSTGDKGEPGLVFCTLDNTQDIFSANMTSCEAASDLILAEEEGAYRWLPNSRTGIHVVNRAPHDVSVALATPWYESANPFCKFDLPPNTPRNFTGRIFVHAFETTDARPGQDVFADPNFLANRITKEGGYDVSKLGPRTYWYVSWHGNEGLKVEISNSRKAKYQRRKHDVDVTSNS